MNKYIVVSFVQAGIEFNNIEEEVYANSKLEAYRDVKYKHNLVKKR